MKTQHIAIRAIKQVDNYHFQIEWNDEILGLYRLSELQKRCPCAKCVDEVTQERRVSAPEVSNNVTAKVIKSVGRYAIRIQFSSGCSSGIYYYDFLRQFLKTKNFSKD